MLQYILELSVLRAPAVKNLFSVDSRHCECSEIILTVATGDCFGVLQTPRNDRMGRFQSMGKRSWQTQ